MLCPTCRSKTEVPNTWQTSAGLIRKRTRQCVSDPDHRFTTVETVELGITLTEVLVRHAGDGSLSTGPFDHTKLERDVARGVLDTLNPQQVHDVVAQTTVELQSNLDTTATGLTPQERDTHRPHRYAITDTRIRQAVEQALRLGQHPLAHVLYALSTLGRQDRAGRHGFQTAADVLTWIAQEDNYPRLASETVTHDHPNEVFWTPPAGMPTTPRWVIKRDRTSRKVYDHDQFLGAIRKAMSGRRNADVTSTMIAKWVLWNLAGQDQILSSQLGAGVASALRRVDDIAYLRWVATEKAINEVRDLVIEARALVSTPSPRLRFIDSVDAV